MNDPVRRRIRVTGVVQGVGFRPCAWRRATRLGLRGFVANDAGGVTIEVEGAAAAVAAFVEGLAAEAPPLARIERIDLTDAAPLGVETAFVILPSGGGPEAAAPVPADVGTCAACLAEMTDPANRRHRHPFVACCDCGPRYTIIDTVPYDRDATTMRAFAMCPRCAAEYHDPADRRFHAQAIGCHDCGPVLRFVTAAAGPGRAAEELHGDAALEAARRLLGAGGIVAVKGVGGYHLACDATSTAAVERLRGRKRRVGKPLAVMVADAAAAAAFAVVSTQERRILESPERPIVLLAKRAAAGPSPLAAAVAPGNDFVGIVLPYAPLHHLLVAGMPPLVMTSGNLSEEPIVHDDATAVAVLFGIADGFLGHDREIRAACDDSVVRCVAGAAVPIRRSRGHAPLPIPLAAAGPAVLAVGGDLKAAVCVAVGRRAVMSQHLGDMANLETLEALGRTAEHLLRLLRVEPEAVAADLHPGHLSTAWARRFAAARGIPLVTVQHHEAHAAALLAEHGLDVAAGPILVACCDGTGYGRDGTIHGGEFFRVEAATPRRVAHLAPFPLPGGDVAIREPWRVALAILHAAGLPWDARLPAVRAADAVALRLLARQLDRGIACVPTTSLGRLFDAIASLVGVRHVVTYEAEAALNLEAVAAAGAAADGAYAFGLDDTAGGPLSISWRGVVAAVVDDLVAGVGPATVAARFHEAVARMVVAVAERVGGAGRMVGLTGGVFQNALLVERTIAGLREAGREPLVHHRVPPNDGGLALGQAVLARRIVGGGAAPALTG